MAASLVKLEEIKKVYGEKENKLTVLEEIHLTVREGEFLGIVGASGSGKTTLMNILGCLDRPTQGRYFLNGQDISRLDDDRLSHIRNTRIGFVFQSFNLIPELTVLENLEVPLFYKKTSKGKRREKCLELLEAVGLSHRLRHYPTQLSGGECQRAAIARSLVNDPTMVLADEPTGNLDSRSGKEILKIFHKLHGLGTTLIMVTHNLDITAQLPRTVEMSDGRITKDHKNAKYIDRGSGHVA
jgi:putative ABC transport system ATP-binding protein